jgi:hypothetical protein
MSGLQPLSPPAKDWVEPPSLPPPSIQQRFTSDGAFRCEAMGIVDPAGCCETSGIERFCCQPCRLVWLNVSSSQLTERGRHYRAQQCLPQEAAVVRAARTPLPRRRRRARTLVGRPPTDPRAHRRSALPSLRPPRAPPLPSYSAGSA